MPDFIFGPQQLERQKEQAAHIAVEIARQAQEEESNCTAASVRQNPINIELCSTSETQQLLATLAATDNWLHWHHLFLVGRAASERASVGFAVAAQRYMVYLQCPSAAAEGASAGYMLPRKQCGHHSWEKNVRRQIASPP